MPKELLFDLGTVIATTSAGGIKSKRTGGKTPGGQTQADLARAEPGRI